MLCLLPYASHLLPQRINNELSINFTPTRSRFLTLLHDITPFDDNFTIRTEDLSCPPCALSLARSFLMFSAFVVIVTLSCLGHFFLVKDCAYFALGYACFDSQIVLSVKMYF